MKRKLLCYLLVLSLVLSCPVTGIKMTVQAADTDTTVTSEDGLYQYEELAEGGISITAYKGENTGDELVIPAEIDGKTVKAIGWKGLGGLNASKVVLPDTLETIKYFAFSASSITSLEIPASVQTIYGGIVEDCFELQSLTVAADNPFFVAEGNIIYNKAKTKIISAAMLPEITIPSTVTEIGEYAFQNDDRLTSITIPGTVKTLGQGCLSECASLVNVNLEEGVEVIGEQCFEATQNLVLLHVPSSVTWIRGNAFRGCTGLKRMYFHGDAPNFYDMGATTGGSTPFSRCTFTAYYPEGNETWDTTAANNPTYGASSLIWIPWDKSAATQDLAGVAEVEVNDTECKYDGSAKKPSVKVTKGESELTQGVDYLISYSDNINAGTAFVYVMGVGNYTGIIKKEFTISKGTPQLRGIVSVPYIMVGETTQILGLNMNPKGCTLESQTPELASVDQEGVVTGLAIGKSVIRVVYPGSENYEAANLDLNIRVIANPAITAAPTQAPAQETSEPAESNEPEETAGVVTPEPADSPAVDVPSQEPVLSPSADVPTKSPSVAVPSVKPSQSPVVKPSQKPTTKPTVKPTVKPTRKPTTQATVRPTVKPTVKPTQKPRTTVKPVQTSKPSQTKAPVKNNTTTKTKQVTYKNAKYRISGTTAEFKALLKGKNVTVPNTITVAGKTYKVTSIAANACKGNKQIVKLTIGKNVKKIGNNAFLKCKKLKQINCNSKLLKPGSVGKNVFKSIGKNAKLKTPKGKTVLYKKLFGL